MSGLLRASSALEVRAVDPAGGLGGRVRARLPRMAKKPFKGAPGAWNPLFLVVPVVRILLICVWLSGVNITYGFKFYSQWCLTRLY